MCSGASVCCALTAGTDKPQDSLHRHLLASSAAAAMLAIHLEIAVILGEFSLAVKLQTFHRFSSFMWVLSKSVTRVQRFNPTDDKCAFLRNLTPIICVCLLVEYCETRDCTSTWRYGLLFDSICVSGIVIPHMLSVGAPSPSPDCLAAVDDCLSNLCKSQQAIYSAVCGGEDNVHTLYLVLGTGDTA